MLGWQAAGIAPGTIGLLWSLSVAAEVLVFFLLGRRLLGWLGVGGTCALAAAAGLLRWSAMALDAPVALLVPMQPLHGLTFAAQHMAAMAMLAGWRRTGWADGAGAAGLAGDRAVHRGAAARLRRAV